MNLFDDLDRDLPRFKPTVFFDVGANVGQSATVFLKRYSMARVFCFEPAAQTFSELRRSFAAQRRVRCFNIALGARKGFANLSKQTRSTRNRVIGTDEQSLTPLERVTVDVLDDFCLRHRVNRIGFLKVDTEGSDLNVLLGAQSMLTATKIDALQVEASMNRDNQLHVPFARFMEFLEPLGYRLFRLYEQRHEWPTGRPNLRRANLVFISAEVIEENRTVA